MSTALDAHALPTDPSRIGPGHQARAPHKARPGIAPGLVLVSVIVGAALALRQIPGLSMLSPMILAILVGMVFHNVVGTPAHAKAGVQFAMRRLLRIAIVLLGLQLTAAQVAEVGAAGLAIIAGALVATFAFTVGLGRLLGVEPKLAELIAAGTSICGASAILATNTVTRASDEDAAYALACITLFGSMAMFAYPLLAGLLDLSPHAYGLWVGASIHEVAQVVAAAFQGGTEAGEFGTVAKLARVMMLAPVVLALGIFAARQARRSGGPAAQAKPPVPWFVFGFIALVGANSLIAVPAEIKAAIAFATTLMLAAALAAMGLETDISKLRAKGVRPLLLAFLATLFIAGLSLGLIEAFA